MHVVAVLQNLHAQRLPLNIIPETRLTACKHLDAGRIVGYALGAGPINEVQIWPPDLLRVNFQVVQGSPHGRLPVQSVISPLNHWSAQNGEHSSFVIHVQNVAEVKGHEKLDDTRS